MRRSLSLLVSRRSIACFDPMESSSAGDAFGALTNPKDTRKSPSAAVGCVDPCLSTALTEFRRSTGATRPYYVFNNTTLAELVSAKPRTLEELARVKGFIFGGKR